MTVPECTFLLSTGKKCRAAASRGRPFCRHHDPAAKAAPAGLRIPKHNLFSRHRRWMVINRDFPHTHPADLPGDIFEILRALLADGEDGISDREAGRLLRGMLRRLGAVPFALPEPTLPNMPTAPAGRAVDPALLRMLASLGRSGGMSDDMSDDDAEPRFPQPGFSQPGFSQPGTPQPSLHQSRPHPQHLQPHPDQLRPDLLPARPHTR